jgi:hypothetical protein
VAVESLAGSQAATFTPKEMKQAFQCPSCPAIRAWWEGVLTAFVGSSGLHLCASTTSSAFGSIDHQHFQFIKVLTHSLHFLCNFSIMPGSQIGAVERDRLLRIWTHRLIVYFKINAKSERWMKAFEDDYKV